MIYIASPYSDLSPFIRNKRYLKAAAYMAKLLKDGINAISPIVLWHEIAIRHNFKLDFSQFETFDLELLKLCNEVHVLKLDGWDSSKGIYKEVAQARLDGQAVRYIDES